MRGNLHCTHLTINDLNEGTRFIALSIERELGRELTATSGARCLECNRKIGSKDNSAHIPKPENNNKGMALDIDTPDSHCRYLLKKALYSRGVKRIGHGKKFLHFDTDKILPQEVEWDY